jgi:hypothetical protein
MKNVAKDSNVLNLYQRCVHTIPHPQHCLWLTMLMSPMFAAL